MENTRTSHKYVILDIHSDIPIIAIMLKRCTKNEMIKYLCYEVFIGIYKHLPACYYQKPYPNIILTTRRYAKSRAKSARYRHFQLLFHDVKKVFYRREQMKTPTHA